MAKYRYISVELRGLTRVFRHTEEPTKLMDSWDDWTVIDTQECKQWTGDHWAEIVLQT